MTTLGDVKATKNATRHICLLTGVTATNSPPTLATDGIPVYPDNLVYSSAQGASYTGNASREAAIAVHSTAGSGTMSCTLKLWGYLACSGVWYPVGVGADTTKGELNAVAAIGETTADAIRHVEPLYLMGLFDRLYLEVVAIGGTATALEAWVTTARTVNY